MDQFEAARLKALKRQERNERYRNPPQQLAETPKIDVVHIEKPEKRNEDAVIDVTVTLPSGTYEYRFVKKRVMREVQFPAKLTKNEFRNRLQEALRPLLGAVNDVDRSHN